MTCAAAARDEFRYPLSAEHNGASPREILQQDYRLNGPLSAEEAFIFNEGMTAASPETAAIVDRRFGCRVQVRER
jgi:hypothetical protein